MPKQVTKKLSWDDIAFDAGLLAQRIKVEEPPFDGIVAITRGGLVPAALIATALGINRIETVCVSSYKDKEPGRVVFHKSMTEMTWGASTERWLVIDDLVDSGETIEAIRLFAPSRATYAVLYAKPKGVGVVDHHVINVPQNTWLHFPWEKEYG